MAYLSKVFIGVAAAATLAGCGSTVGIGAGQQANSLSQNSLGLISGAAPSAGNDTGARLPSDAATAASGSASPSRVQASSETGSSNADDSSTNGIGSPLLNNGPGVTASTINVGMVYSPDEDQYEAALGNTNDTTGNLKLIATLIANDINKHGGAAGRKLSIIFDSSSATSGQSVAQQAAAVCAFFTQDHHVFAGLPLGDSDYLTCMQKAHTVSVGASLATFTEADYRSFPDFYDTQALSTDRVVANLVRALVAENYFAKWNARTGAPGSAPVKVGVLTPDQPFWESATKDVLLPALARAGYPVAAGDLSVWPFPDSAAGDGATVSAIQAAALKFRSDNVTHVIPVEINGLGFFAPGAQSQGYHPRYGISSAAQAQAEAGTIVPYAQLTGAVGLGFSPIVDLPESANPDNGKYAGPGRQHCLAVLKAGGVTFAHPSEEADALALCDIFYSLQRTLNLIPRTSPVTAASFMSALGTVGSSFQAAALPKGFFGPRQHYAATVGYQYAYDGSCKCFKYTSNPFNLS